MTRFANVGGRMKIVLSNAVADVEVSSAGRFGPDPQQVYRHWDEFSQWLQSAQLLPQEPLPTLDTVGPPSPEPPQIIALGVNSHIKLLQFGLGRPSGLGFISKLRGALTGPGNPITRTSEKMYVETEVAVVIGRSTRNVTSEDALSHVAGFMIAQDLVDSNSYVRIESTVGKHPVVYFNPAKSLAGFVPTGPWLVTPDEVQSIDDLRIRQWIDDRLVQDGRTTDYLHGVREAVSELSQSITLFPGDVLLMGSPGQVDTSPLEPLDAGAVVRGEVDGLGVQQHLITSSDSAETFAESSDVRLG
ncbi:2,4-diketo-3-deoxy-L-fuconate hydrolase [Rhodococcus sp. 27YEA15]|uniref:fumarylacetoacetate hydrolase family protein n=1 Tax=Rhodococcus sp. 27YEA15 TaxID=3156259 RepID=UPI003C7E8E11